MGTLSSLHNITCWSFKCACSPASNCKTGRMLSRMVHPILRVERTAWQIIPTATPLCHTVEHSATTTHGGSMQCASQRDSIVPIANHKNERPGEAWVQYHSPRRMTAAFQMLFTVHRHAWVLGGMACRIVSYISHPTFPLLHLTITSIKTRLLLPG